MIRPRRLSAFVRKILVADPEAKLNINLRGRSPFIEVCFKSALAKDEIVSTYDIGVVSSSIIDHRGKNWPEFFVRFDASELSEEPDHDRGTGFSFDRVKVSKRERRAVTRQEEEGAALIGGRRHVWFVGRSLG